MPDRSLVSQTITPAPKDYTLSGTQQLQLKSVRAVIDGSGAAGAFLPVLQLLAPDGTVMWQGFPSSTVAAGASADVSWFPHVGSQAAQSSTLPATEAFYVDTRVAAGATSSTVLANGVSYLVSVQGTYSIWNSDLGNGTPESDAQFPTSGGVARLSTQVGLDAECCFATPTPFVPPPAIGHVTYMQFNAGSGWAHQEPFDGAHTTPAANHYYSYTVVGQGSPLSCRMLDPGGAGQYADNYGNFLVTIYAIPGGGSGSISDVTSTGGSITVTSPTGPTTNLDLPASGVTAGTYGDGSHVARVTVAADGVVTAASSVAITGGAGTGLVQLYDSTLGASGTFDTGAGGIAAGHAHLVLVMHGRTTDASIQGDIGVRFNNDSGANYDYTSMQAFNGAPASGNNAGTTYIQMATLPGAGSTASVFGSATMWIPNYEAAQYKATNSMGGAPGVWWVGQVVGYWANTAAITRIQVHDPTGGSFVAGTRLTIYGTA